jgi:hypothetical protein
MPYTEALIASIALAAAGSTPPMFNPQTAASQVVGEGISSAASTITLEAADAPTGNYVTIGTASPGAAGFFRIGGSSAARHLRLRSSAASTLSSVLIAAHD